MFALSLHSVTVQTGAVTAIAALLDFILFLAFPVSHSAPFTSLVLLLNVAI
jgi:hypothetical protein